MNIKVVLCISLQLMLVSGMPGNPNFGICQAYVHERDLDVPGCNLVRISDRMCRGKCHSVAIPQFTKNHQEEFQAVEDSGITIQQANGKKTCNMCLPIRHSQKTFTLTCKKEKKVDDSLPFFLNDPLPGEYEQREHVVDILEECMCTEIQCDLWKNPKKLQETFGKSMKQQQT
jgi:DAN domain.